MFVLHIDEVGIIVLDEWFTCARSRLSQTKRIGATRYKKIVYDDAKCDDGFEPAVLQVQCPVMLLRTILRDYQYYRMLSGGEKFGRGAYCADTSACLQQ